MLGENCLAMAGDLGLVAVVRESLGRADVTLQPPPHGGTRAPAGAASSQGPEWVRGAQQQTEYMGM